jgi:hypothetical protein
VIHDEAAVNGGALDKIKDSGDLEDTLDSICMSHTLSNAGEKFNVPNVSSMNTNWNALVSHSPATQLRIRRAIGAPCPRLTNDIRWYCSWELNRNILHDFDRIAPCLDEIAREKDPPQSLSKLVMSFTVGTDQAMRLTRATNIRNLKFELMTLVTYGRPMCQLTYYFERSQHLTIAFALEKIDAIKELLVPEQDLPAPLAQLITAFGRGFDSVDIWKKYRDGIITPVHLYIEKKFSQDRPNPKKIKATRRYHVIRLLQLAQLIRPSRFLVWYRDIKKRENPNNQDLFRLELEKFQRDIPFLTAADVAGLLGEIAPFRRYAKEVKNLQLRASNLMSDFWTIRHTEHTLPAWHNLARRIALISSSTADVERVVSVFSDVIGDTQENVLEHALEARVLVRFNNRKPKNRIQRRFYDDGKLPSDEEENFDSSSSSEEE